MFDGEYTAQPTAFYDAALALVGEGLLAVDEKGRILWTNQQAGDIFGRDLSEMARCTLDDLIAHGTGVGTASGAAAGDASADDLFLLAQSGRGRVGRLVTGRRADGGVAELLVRIVRHDTDGAPCYLLAVRDVAIEREYQRTIRHRSEFDFVTQLHNRDGFRGRARERLEQAQANGEAVWAAILNVSGIGKINHWIGFEAGDVALHEIGSRLRRLYPGDAILGRVDGNEFAIMAPIEMAPESAEAWAAELNRLGRDIDLGGRRVDIQFTGGAADSADVAERAGRTDFETLYVRVRGALHEARTNRAETGGLCFYDAAIARREHLDRRLEDELVDALSRDEFFLHYQPKFDMRGRVAGYEALLRWRTADGDLIPPGVFVPIAEANGTIRTIGAWVFQQACQLAVSEGLAAAGQRVAVNLSPRQMEQEGLPDMLAKIAADSGVDPDTIELEVTESWAVEDYARGSGVLSRLKACGFSISLDDFGTGYSSLGALVRLPVDLIKIDRSLLPLDTADDIEARKLLTATIELCRAMGRQVLVEGVETAAQYEMLAETGCDFVQGYYFGHPQRFEAVRGPGTAKGAAAGR